MFTLQFFLKEKMRRIWLMFSFGLQDVVNFLIWFEGRIFGSFSHTYQQFGWLWDPLFIERG